jgi:DNA mismatch repair protein MSH5
MLIQAGFLVALNKDMVLGQAFELPPDFTHIFNQDEEAFFKNTEMRGLDQNIGDLDGLIKDTESMIVTELEESILDSENELRESFKALSELDCILSFADCAVDLNFTHPRMVEAATNRICVKDGRHPLQEVITEKEFIPNDVLVDENDCLVVVTGPNYSGKSCSLRQVGLLVYMAHIGSFIPCTEAEISITDQICARICTVETCAVPQSSFQLDLTQMASILLKCTSNSLVLIDEFGKGTSPASGIAILGAALKKLSQIRCKTICTTHFLELFSMNVIQDQTNGIKARRMAIHLPKDEEDGASPLFKLEDGVASSSAGLICAKKAGVNHEVISRAKEIIQTMREWRQIQPMAKSMPQLPELSSGETDMLHFNFSVNSWERASEEQLRTLIQKIARI